MKQEVIFVTAPTSNPNEEAGSRQVINACNELEVELLTRAIEEHTPTFKSNNVLALITKKVIHTVRHECPCCYPVLTALVEVTCINLHWTEDQRTVSGLYKVSIGPEAMGGGPTKITVTKLAVTETVIFEEAIAGHPLRRR
ncbi:MAG: hypothetical protein G01um101424_133 [Parcubacteria group bacterium Gr01-1014_24]|nr:MAG: hypothetical protein G01um101424_133 [Parcubacteria group bacterium Gr01-1014_24]